MLNDLWATWKLGAIEPSSLFLSSLHLGLCWCLCSLCIFQPRNRWPRTCNPFFPLLVLLVGHDSSLYSSVCSSSFYLYIRWPRWWRLHGWRVSWPHHMDVVLRCSTIQQSWPSLHPSVVSRPRVRHSSSSKYVFFLLLFFLFLILLIYSDDDDEMTRFFSSRPPALAAGLTFECC